MSQARIKKGDIVRVIAGDDSGKTGKVLRMIPKDGRAVVEGVKLAKKHQRARKHNERGQIIDKATPIHVSNLRRTDKGDKKVSAKK